MIGLETKRNKMRCFWEVEIEREIKSDNYWKKRGNFVEIMK